jgi:hypothetical protein
MDKKIQDQPMAPAASPSAPVPPSPPPEDPFDLESLRVGQDFLTTGGVKKHYTTVPARKPNASEWFRLHHDEKFRLDTLVLELKDSRECYLIAPALRAELVTEPLVSARRLFLGVTRAGSPFVWPVRLPGPDGRPNRWTDTALEAAAAATKEWVRLQADMGLGGYVFFTPAGELAPPQWPEMAFTEILRLAFRNNFIDSHDHIVLRQLRGEV